MKETINISVRELVEFVLRNGDLNSLFIGGNNRALEGTKIHGKIQKKNKKEYDNLGYTYESEVVLKHTVEYDDFTIQVEGRADGIIHEGENYCIDEIKTTTKPKEELEQNINILHLAQAKCYSYFFALDNEIKNISVQLTYYNVDTNEISYIKSSHEIKDLETFFNEVVEKYYVFARFQVQWIKERNESIEKLQFPYENYRKGQRELAVYVYRTIENSSKLYAQAPTGIGKTMSTIFPSIKAMEKGYTSKIFYLTAKTITRTVAKDAVEIMTNKSLKAKTIVLTAKEKICLNEECVCNGDSCIYAKGHYDRVNEAILDIINHEDMISREVIEKYAKIHKVCPFEFSLDISYWMDIIICDYNYMFDPNASLKRFFNESKNDFTILIDEAHNLVDRSREMFSASLSKKEFLQCKKYVKSKNKQIFKTLGKLNTYMLENKKRCEETGFIKQKEEPEEIYPLLYKFIMEAEEWLIINKESDNEELLQLYFNVLNFMKISELYGEEYVTYFESNKEDTIIKLYCVNPSINLKSKMKLSRACVLFSATLTPIDYYKQILGGEAEDKVIKLQSPFNPENLCLTIASDVSTKYKNRSESYDKISDYIYSIVDLKKGNHFVFFPSYAYMTKVHEEFINKYPDIKVIIQSSNMKEEERDAFLNNFNEECDNIVAFAVLGGIFSEGIDLKGEKLIGTIIVGVGLPQICLERDIIKEYFNETNNNTGYQYSYVYPGFNKVLQAAGRVIRSEKDKGTVLLIDDRFIRRDYISLFPREWMHYKIVRNNKQLESILKSLSGDSK